MTRCIVWFLKGEIVRGDKGDFSSGIFLRDNLKKMTQSLSLSLALPRQKSVM